MQSLILIIAGLSALISAVVGVILISVSLKMRRNPGVNPSLARVLLGCGLLLLAMPWTAPYLSFSDSNWRLFFATAIGLFSLGLSLYFARTLPVLLGVLKARGEVSPDDAEAEPEKETSARGRSLARRPR